MSQNLKLSYAHRKKYMSTEGEEKSYVLIELTGAPLIDVLRSPINLSLVLDRSGSMSGKPLDYCKEACEFVVDQLTNKDILSVVTFDGDVETVVSPQKVTHKDLLKKHIQRIHTRGITNLSGGLIEGCQHVLKQEMDQYVNRVILLSDGIANAGIRDPQLLLKLAEDYASAGLVISTLGVSDRFEEETLEGIADNGKGNFHYIDEVDSIPDIFSQELEELLSNVAQNIKLKINPKNGVTITNIYGYNFQSSENSVLIPLGDSYANEVKSLLVEYSLPPMGEGEHDIFDMEWSYVDTVNGFKECCFSVNVPVRRTKDLNQLLLAPDTYTESKIQTTLSAVVLEQAIQFFDQGNLKEGKDMIYQHASQMKEVAADINSPELLVESEGLINELSNFTYSSKKRKVLNQEKYRRKKRRQ
ncbi:MULTISPECIES: vWA domain-containing protein [Bacillaceae]|uniref:VWA domain-containing protein n=1 Tax=Evansella alkalicola TaxID=745819 RepID=A0ABS6JSY6_9BACI|nr:MULTISPECIES: VWA domain-containing protein [Bacillaceae]MBU9720270.1 VWA domain-containing protein [Bacillus alkalicola]